ncbi:MAG TPA: histidinol-phosphate transaminase [Hyphomonadaceae bacterium]|jgi:histidinol-phosphate aminotransferase|nr:histidinol-phosphate transaminase [Hyphomonadaceae bacterium]
MKNLADIKIPERILRAVADGGPDAINHARRAWLKAAGVGAAAVSVTALAQACSPTATAAPTPAAATPPAPKGPAILASNESPFGPSPKAVDEMSKVLTLTARYANAETVDLQKKIAAIEGVDYSQVFIANGSSPILQAYGEMISQKGKGELVTSVATYEGVPRAAKTYGAHVIETPLTKEFGIDLDAMSAKVSKKTTGIYVNNPNNPTGNMVSAAKLKAFAEAHATPTTPVFIDEAYLDLCDDYAGNVMTGLVRDGKNVIIGRTFSKIYGMAGQRIGYGIAQKELAQDLAGAVRLGGVNHLGLVAAMASLDDKEFVPAMKPKFAAGRARLLEMVKATGRPYAPNPQASFVFMDVGMPNKVFAEKMAAEGVMVVGRTWAGYENWTRMCVGEDWELDRAATALKKVLA